jgi:hypothetical protein
MKQNWKIIDLIIKPNKSVLQKSHCMIPTPIKIKKNIFRIYYASRDKKKVSRIFFSDYDLLKKRIVKSPKNLVLDIGKLGAFDDNGVNPSSLIKHNNKDFLFYIGWNKKSKVRMNLFGGISSKKLKKNKFERVLESPIIERSKYDHLFNTAPFVIKKNKLFVMYYCSTFKWINELTPCYSIKLCTSKNLLDWNRRKEYCIKLKKNEYAIGRPYVIYHKNIYKMWYSYKKNNYQIGYAESKDGISWKRKDKLIKFYNPKKFNFKMMEFASVIEFQNKLYMFFNGNDYGYDGIYLAELY